MQTAANNHAQDLYHNNRDVYQRLRYGVPVKVEAGVPNDTVPLIDWQEPEKNDFYIAEEVTVLGEKEKRPDIVLYINGIAVAVLELKNSRVSIGDGIRQNLVNQKPVFIGFTGTPLLKKDKSTSLEVFGKYIYTYKFNEAVEDGVVLDLVYEARDIDQRLRNRPNALSLLSCMNCCIYLSHHTTVALLHYMDKFLPKWRFYRDQLNSLPVRHEDWQY